MRAPVSVRFPQALYSALENHAISSPDAEVCGLIGGLDDRFATAYPVANVATDPTCRFVMDGRGQLAAMRAMSERGETWLGIYHSHVDAPAYPSDRDLEQHAYPDMLCVIVSPGVTPHNPIRAFWVRDRIVQEVLVEVEQ